MLNELEGDSEDLDEGDDQLADDPNHPRYGGGRFRSFQVSKHSLYIRAIAREPTGISINKTINKQKQKHQQHEQQDSERDEKKHKKPRHNLSSHSSSSPLIPAAVNLPVAALDPLEEEEEELL